MSKLCKQAEKIKKITIIAISYYNNTLLCKMATRRKDVLPIARLLCGLFLCFMVRKKFVFGSDVIGLCLNHHELLPEDTNITTSSLWVNKVKKSLLLRTPRYSHLCLILLLAGDVETDPGPVPELKNLSSLGGGKFFHQNVRGLLQNIDKVKILLKDYPKIDILTISETHINSNSYNDNIELYKIPGYTFINRNRRKGKSGGVGMYISDTLKWERRDDLEDPLLEATWIEIFQKSTKSFLLGTMYRPPAGSKYLLNKFNTLLDHMLSVINVESKEILLLGDMNIDYLKKENNKPIKDIFQFYNLKQIITKPTRITSTSHTLIDCILTTNETNIISHDVIPTSIADHDMVGCVRKLHTQKFNPKVIKTRNYAKYDPDALRSDLKQTDWRPLYRSGNVNNAWKILKNILQAAFNKHAPFFEKRIRGKLCPWLTHQRSTGNEKP